MIEPVLFPHQNHPYRLEFGDDKKNVTICWFECEEHLEKYITRYKLDKRTLKISYRDGQPVKSGKTNKAKVRQATGKSSNRSTSRSKGSTKDLDAGGNVNRTRKSTK